jgi:hypothetical protein
MSQSARFSVYNPAGRLVQTVEQPAAQSVSAPLAPRLDTLEGKTIYLVDTGFGGSFKFMRELERWFACNMPSVKTVRTRKPGGPFADDNDALWRRSKSGVMRPFSVGG